MGDALPRTKIVCTIGPASRSPEVLRELVAAGMSVARINCSHGDPDSHLADLAAVRAAAAGAGRPVAVLADLQGPKLRLGDLPAGGLLLERGQEVTLVPEGGESGSVTIPVQLAELPAVVRPGDPVLLDDGLVALEVVAVRSGAVVCRVADGGRVTSRKGLNLPRAPAVLAALTPRDVADAQRLAAAGVDWLALSFVRRGEDLVRLQEVLLDQAPPGVSPVPVMAKIEKPEAVERLEEILAVADGVMVARGDLAVETSPEEVPLVQKQVIRRSLARGLPVVTATQMLESMTREVRPTRAEASDVANAILDGSDAVMLSAETAIGDHPAAVVRTMARIARHTEAGCGSFRHALPEPAERPTVAVAVARAAVDMAVALGARAIVCPTVSGHTARMVARFRPGLPVVAATPDERVQRQLCLVRSVIPLLAPRREHSDHIIAEALAAAVAARVVRRGERVVVTAGVAGHVSGGTDLIRVLEA